MNTSRLSLRRPLVESSPLAAAAFTQLQEAVANNDANATQIVLARLRSEDKSEILNSSDKDGFRLLHRACALGSVELMSVLLANGADPNAKDSCGDAPMHWACFSGNLFAVLALLKNGGDPLLASSDGKTPLDAALEEKHTHILQLLFGRPWNMYDQRAVLEAILLRGHLRIKVPSRYVNNRRVWRIQHVVLSSMLRSLFICRGKDMTDSAQDAEHVRFQDLITVRWVRHTRTRYLERRFNVYAFIDDPRDLKFTFASSGMDDDGAGDYTISGNDGEEIVDEDEKASDGGRESLPGAAADGRLSQATLRLREALRKGVRSLRRPRAKSQESAHDAADEASGSGKSFKRKGKAVDGVLYREDGDRFAICVSFLADSAREARRWVEAFRFAGLQGGTLPCVRIQSAWRGYAARCELKRLQSIQITGATVASRRASKEASYKHNFVPLDASYTKPPPPPPSVLASFGKSAGSTALTTVSKTKSLFTHPTMIFAPKPEKSKTTSSRLSKHPSFELPSSFKQRRSNALAVPTNDEFTNVEDMSGYLKKRSETGMAGALHLWRKRFCILSSTAGELQYYNAKYQNDKNKRIVRLPYSSMLGVSIIERKEKRPGSASSDNDDPSLEEKSEKSTSALGRSFKMLGGGRRRKESLRFVIRVVGGLSYRFEAANVSERVRWINAIERVLPRENVAAVLVQRVWRGFKDRRRVNRLRLLALQKAMQKRDEALLRIEEARQRGAAEIEARATLDELAVLTQFQLDEKEHRKRMRTEKKKAAAAGVVMDASSPLLLESKSRSSSVGGEKELPLGWKSHIDKKTGRAFYHNKVTKETSWHFPQPRHAAVSEPVLEKSSFLPAMEKSEKRKQVDIVVEEIKLAKVAASVAAAEPVAKKKTTSPETRRGSRSSSLLPDWQELIDAKTNEIYYFNSLTGESSWTKPTKSKKNIGWSKKLDTSSGQYYYYDERSGASQWEVPEGYKDDEDEECEDEDDVQAAAATPIVIQPKVEEIIETVPEAKSPKPVVGAAAIPEKRRKNLTRPAVAARDSTSSYDAAAETAAIASLALSENKKSVNKDGRVKDTPDLAMRLLRKSLEKSTLKRSHSDAWQRFVDKKSGTSFYVNSETGEKTWIKPAALGGPKSKHEAWLELTDDEGRAYYSNSITGESVWTLPDGDKLANENPRSHRGLADNSERKSIARHSVSSVASEPLDENEIVAAFTRHVDSLLANFPRNRARSYHDDDADELEEELLSRSFLDEEDDPYHYLALHERGGLFEAVRTGLLLCRLVNRVAPESIDPRTMNIDVDALYQDSHTPEQQERVLKVARENHVLCLGAIRSLGGSLSDDVTPESLMGAADFFMTANHNGGLDSSADISSIISSSPSGGARVNPVEEERRKRIVLEVIWEILQIDLFDPVSIVACRPLLNLLGSRGEDKEEERSLHEFDGLHESAKLLKWLAYHRDANPKVSPAEVTGVAFTAFGGVGSMSLFLVSLACAVWADSTTSSGSLSSSAYGLPELAASVLNNASTLSASECHQLAEQIARVCQSLGIRLYASRAECLATDDSRLQLACAAAVFARHHGLPINVLLNKEEQEELKDLSYEHGSDQMREERILRAWVNSLNVKLRSGARAPDATISPRMKPAGKGHSKATICIKNVFVDLKDGVVLMHVLSSLDPSLESYFFESNSSKVHLNPIDKLEMLENASLVLEACKSTLNLSAVTLGSFDLVDGNRKLVLALCWQIMRYASLKSLNSLNTSIFSRIRQGLSLEDDVDSRPAGTLVTETDILRWANDKVRMHSMSGKIVRVGSVKFVERPLDQTVVKLTPKDDDGYEDMEELMDSASDKRVSLQQIGKRSSLRSSLKRSSVETVKDIISFKDALLVTGCYFLTLIDGIRPGLVNWKHAVSESSIDTSTYEGMDACERNAKYVVSLALKLGCTVFLSWEDVVQIKPKALLMFVAALIVLDNAETGLLQRSTSL